jgi:hypothetical protein
MNERFNKTINAITLSTPLGCMGEAHCFTARMERSGALIYFGNANVERLGEHLGAVGEYSFDMLASVIETSGFLNIDEYGASSSTAGEDEIEVETTQGLRRFSRDPFSTCPLFWGVMTLCLNLIERATWGDEAYKRATTDPATLPEPIHKIEADLNYDRRILPPTAGKRHLQKHRVQPPESRGDCKWIAYRFEDGTYIEYDRSDRTYVVCLRGFRTGPRTMTEIVSIYDKEE